MRSCARAMASHEAELKRKYLESASSSSTPAGASSAASSVSPSSAGRSLAQAILGGYGIEWFVVTPGGWGTVAVALTALFVVNTTFGRAVARTDAGGPQADGRDRGLPPVPVGGRGRRARAGGRSAQNARPVRSLPAVRPRAGRVAGLVRAVRRPCSARKAPPSIRRTGTTATVSTRITSAAFRRRCRTRSTPRCRRLRLPRAIPRAAAGAAGADPRAEAEAAVGVGDGRARQ